MVKRLLFFLTLLMITGIAAGWYFFARESRYLGTSPIKAIPVESPIFVRIPHLGDFAKKTINSNCWKSLRSIESVARVYGEFAFIDSLIHLNKEIENFLMHKEMFAVPGENSTLYLFEMGSIGEKNSVNSLISSYFISRNRKAKLSAYKDASLQQYEWIEKGEKFLMLITFYRGVLMASNNENHLRSSIDQMGKPSLLDDPDYRRVNKNATENIDLNIFINHQAFPAFSSSFCTDSVATGILQPDYAKWTEVDVVQKENQLLVNGFSVTDSTWSNYLDVFKRQKPLPGSIIRLIPSNTTFFAAQHLSASADYFEDYMKFLDKHRNQERYRIQDSLVSRELQLNLRQYFMDFWTGEAAVVYTNQNLEDKADNRFLLLKVKPDPNDPLVRAIKKWTVSGRNSQPGDKTSEANKNNIWKVPVEDFGKLIGASYFGSVETKWMTSSDGFLLMGSTPGSLVRYLNLLKRDDLLLHEKSYAQLATGQAQSSNFFLWCAPGNSLPFFESFLKPVLFKSLTNSVGNLKKLENFSWQWGYENGLIYNTATLSVNPDAIDRQIPFWKYPLKAKLRNKPVFVSFSNVKKEKELVFQDQENYLIDLDKEGRERWKIHLEGAIMGSIKLIEIRKSGEYQLLFNTKNAIHAIDRYGLEIKNFPVRLKSAATNEMSVFDYDGQKDYRYLIACSDHKVYNFDKNGKMLAGWQPKTTESNVEFPVRHYRIGTKDFIVFSDSKRIYVLDRQGKERVKMQDDFVRSGNDITLLSKNGIQENLVTTDEHGKIRILGFDGSMKKISVGNFSTGHFFLSVDFGGDGKTDFLFFDKQKLARYDINGKLVFSLNIEDSMGIAPDIFCFGNEKYIEVISTTENRTILVRKDGTIFDSFLSGNFDLPVAGFFGAEGKIANIIVSTPEGYLSNYQMILK